jgi:two-component system chemotaxis response regulator CheY
LKVRALVVDDSQVMRGIVMRSLTNSGIADFEFTEAGDGAEALTKFSPANTDIIFVDWNMPVMTGIELVRRVRDNPRAAQVPIVMVTSEKTMGKMEDALDKAHANAYICKPFTIDDLKRQVSPLLKGIGSGAKQGGFFSKLMS